MDNEKPAESSGTRRAKVTCLIPPAVALFAFVVYYLTLAQEVGPGDSAELALQAYRLGVTHPPGYPVHTWAGKLFMLLLAEPAAATNLLSAVSAAMAVGLLSSILLKLTERWASACFAPLLFALTPRVWEAAVVTEAYVVNVCVLGLALWLAVSWHHRPVGWRLWASAGVLGLSMGSSLANLMLVPGFLVLLRRERRYRWRRIAGYLLIVLVVGCAVLSWTYFRARTILLIGAVVVPDTPGDLITFLTGAQYSTLEPQPIRFYLHRFAEHGYFLGAAFLWLGLALGLVGVTVQWKRDRVFCISFLLIFLVNFGYFTGHPWVDYQQMVAPSYFVFAIWIGFGLAWLYRLRTRAIGPSVAVVVSVALVAGLLMSGHRTHRERGGGTPVTDFVLRSFGVFPDGAVVFAEWYKFTPLLYFQQVHGLRPDLTILERSYGPRWYSDDVAALPHEPLPARPPSSRGTEGLPPSGRGRVYIEDWRGFMYETARSRPVVIDVIDAEPLPGYAFESMEHAWYRVVTTVSVEP